MIKEFAALGQSWTKNHLGLKPHVRIGIPVPPDANRRRIHGLHPVTPDSHLETGYETCASLFTIAHVYGFTGGVVMDWGVGCGRIARFAPREVEEDFIGVDIDQMNVDWCRQHLPFGTFDRILPRGMITVGASTIDLLYGFSVMTHMTEENQDHFLKEINRVIRGLAILSVHGSYMLSLKEVNRGMVSILSKRDGFHVSDNDNPDISDVVPRGYYRDTAHAAHYIKSHWSRFIRVIDVIPGGFGGLHDAVVCRKL